MGAVPWYRPRSYSKTTPRMRFLAGSGGIRREVLILASRRRPKSAGRLASRVAARDAVARRYIEVASFWLGCVSRCHGAGRRFYQRGMGKKARGVEKVGEVPAR